MKKLIAMLVLVCGIAISQTNQPQDKSQDLASVQKNFMNYVIYAGELEKTNANLMGQLQRVANDLKKITTSAQLDSLKQEYGIIPKSEKKK